MLLWTSPADLINKGYIIIIMCMFQYGKKMLFSTVKRVYLKKDFYTLVEITINGMVVT